MDQHFFLEGTYLGTAARRLDLRTGAFPLSYGFFCQACGEVFATCPIAGRGWQFWARTCRKCPGGLTLGEPGSIWLSWDTEFTSAFPEAVLKWEFLRLLEQYDRTQSDPTHRHQPR
jgi:hypothetical protein